MKERIVFMGTPDFAVPCLDRLLESGYIIPAVFTQPDRPKGRGQKSAPPPVKTLASECGIPVYQPAKLRDGTALNLLRECAPDLIVVVAYGRILPTEILELPRCGCVNVHASLLPKLRGAAPIQWSVINGDEETGVTIMKLSEGMDEGDIIAQASTRIGPDETAGELFERLSALGAEALLETIPTVFDGTASYLPQNHGEATCAPMIEKSMASVDFSKPAMETKNIIRGMNPSPCAYTMYDGKRLRIHTVRLEPDFSGSAGEILRTSPLIVGCGNGALRLVTVQPEGKASMSGEAFANGKHLKGGEIFRITE